MPELTEIPPVFPESGKSLSPNESPASSRQSMTWKEALGDTETNQELAPTTTTDLPPNNTPVNEAPVDMAAALEDPLVIQEDITPKVEDTSSTTSTRVILNAAIKSPDTATIVSLAEAVRSTHTPTSLSSEAPVEL